MKDPESKYVVPDQAIAVVGIGLRFAGASTPNQFWRNLRDGVRSIKDYDEAELRAAGVADEQLRSDHYVRSGASIGDTDRFDADFFGFSPKEAAIMDPQHRKFLECCWEALEDSTHPPSTVDGPVGVFGGCGMNSYFMFNLLRNPAVRDSVGMFLLRHTGNDKDFFTTRVSYCLNLRGPSINVQTACSTSLVAIHMAVQSLLAGECDMALAGGSTIELPYGHGYEYKDGEILSPDGHCRAFDSQSAGTVFGSGTGSVVLRRLEDAIADGDRIYSVIRGSAINNDGASKAGYLAPSIDQQAAVAAESMAIAGVDADSIGFVAAHGTGTPIGDPIEITALSSAFGETTDRKQYCVIGSVKPNIGHTDTAAGVASFIAASLSLCHRIIPPSVDFRSPNPAIDFSNSPFLVTPEHRSYPVTNTPPRAMVHSLGVGGTNANVVLEAAPIANHADTAEEPSPMIVALSAKSLQSLDDQSLRLADHLLDHADVNLADVAYTLAVGREPFAKRRVLVARDSAETAALFRSGDPNRVFTHDAKTNLDAITFLFPGGGSQYLRMGDGLYQSEPVFRDVIDRGCEALISQIDVDLRSLVFADDDTANQLERPGIQLPAIFLWEVALAKLWMANGITPTALLGHSMGENTAACIAGVMSMDDAMRLVVMRGRLLESVRGGMMTVAAAPDQARSYLGDDLDIAVVNGPSMCVVSGTDDALEVFATKMQLLNIETRRIPIRIAAHSRLLDAVLPEFHRFLQTIDLNQPQIPIVSNRTGTWLTDAEATSPDYWCDQLRHTVRFADGIETISKRPSQAFMEVGPGKILSALLKQHPSIGPDQAVLSSLRHPDQPINDQTYFLTSLGRLWAAGVPVDLAEQHRGQPRRRIGLPTYAFRQDRYWINATEHTESNGGQRDQPQPLARATSVNDWLSSPQWSEFPVQDDVLERQEGSNWLIFVDDAGVADATIDLLEQSGAGVIRVRVGDVFHQVSDHEYTVVPELGIETFELLAESLGEAASLPNHVLYFWPITADQSHRPGSTFATRMLEEGVFALHHVIRSLASKGHGEFDLIVATNNAESVDGEVILHPEKQTVRGPVAVAPREYPGITSTCIDVIVPPSKDVPALAKQLIAVALESDHVGNVEAIRRGKRYRWQLRSVPTRQNDDNEYGIAPKLGGTYLITGGLGGIGYQVALWLAKEYHASLILVGRSADSAHTDAVGSLQSLGGRVCVVAADVADPFAMRQALDVATSELGKVDGVFHAAGSIDDQLIEAASVDSIENVLAAKVHGTRILQSLFQSEPLDFFIAFASTSTVLGAAGQSAYVAANQFISAFARSNPFPNTPTRTIAIHWGVWKSIGMAAQLHRDMIGGDDRLVDEETNPCGGLFDRVGIDPASGKRIYLASRHAANDWIFNEHRTPNGDAVLPGTGAIELMTAAVMDAVDRAAIGLIDLTFLQPCVVPDEQTIQLRVTVDGDASTGQIELQSRLRSEDRWKTHVTASANEMDDEIVVRRSIERVELAPNKITTSTDQAKHLKFGPRWDCYREIQYFDHHATATLKLDDAFAADLASHPLHPALLDMATGFGLPLVPGYDASSPMFVPAGYDSISVFGPLTDRLRSTIRLSKPTEQTPRKSATFDAEVTDDDGNLLVRVTSLQMVAVDSDSFAKQTSASGAIAGNRKRTSGLSASERLFDETYRLGIEPAEGIAALEQLLADPSLPPSVFVSPVDLDLIKTRLEILSRPAVDDGVQFARPATAGELAVPVTPTQKWLAGIWKSLLGIDKVGIHDGFFDLGGHSLLAVRFFAALRKQRGVDYPLATLFDAPTIGQLAALVDADAGDDEAANAMPTRSHRFLVPLHVARDTRKPPVFIVGGMFGNVLNLRYLAKRLGANQTVYGVQAKGLLGDDLPHRRFQEMACDYLAEIRSVQPEGPYFIGGFSGGGVSAFEMAVQLNNVGDRVGMLFMLDTPAVRHDDLTWIDKAKIHWDEVRRHGFGYLSLWRNDRREWTAEQKISASRQIESTPDNTGAEFRSAQIGDAFLDAHANYQTPTLSSDVHLYRPPLPVAHHLPGGRCINADRVLLDPLNHWTPHVHGQIHLREVAGDHDTMVLEPNVRTLASMLKRDLEAAMANLGSVSSSSRDLQANPFHRVPAEVNA